jgi:hypothetical protein
LPVFFSLPAYNAAHNGAKTMLGGAAIARWLDNIHVGWLAIASKGIYLRINRVFHCAKARLQVVQREIEHANGGLSRHRRLFARAVDGQRDANLRKCARDSRFMRSLAEKNARESGATSM